MLPSSTLAKLLRDCFSEDTESASAIDVASKDQKAWLTTLISRLAVNERASFRIVEDRHGNDGVFVSMKLAGVADKRSPHDWFQIQFKSGDVQGLHLVDANYRRRTKLPPTAIQRVEHIEKFITEVRARQDREHLRSKRSQKLVGFQKQGLTARLRELGSQHNFAFAVNENVRDIKLSIRIEGRKTGYHFKFAKTKLERMLEQLPDLVTMLQKMQMLGIHFTTEDKILKQSPQFAWIEPSAEEASMP